MLTVPDRIKELFHLDSCKKNIRIHFPNGERSDICNDLIVKNSVSFKESLCSQNTLKFGLCEASVFECETVGVGNIKGATIEVTCEIFCESDVEDAMWQMDLQAWVYAIPYGTFVVDTCQRQADMIHRKITAYTSNDIYYKNDEARRLSNLRVYCTNFEDAKNLLRVNYGGDYSYSVIKRIYNKLNTFPMDLLTELESENINVSETNQGAYVYTINSGYNTYRYRAEIYFYSGAIKTSNYGSDNVKDDYLYRINLNDAELTDDEICDALKQFVYNNQSFWESYPENTPIFLNACEDLAYCKYDMQSISNGTVLFSNTIGTLNSASDNASGSVIARVVCPCQNPSYIYKYNTTGNSTADNQSTTHIFIPIRMHIEIRNTRTSQHVSDDIIIRDVNKIQGTIKAFSVENESIRLSEPRVQVKDGSYSGYRVESTWGDFDEILESFMELSGEFLRWGRTDNMQIVNLKQQFGLLPDTDLYPDIDLYPEGVTGGKLFPEDYQSCWYDDEYTQPFGAITCNFKNTNNEDCVYTLYLFDIDDSSLDNYQIYDLSDNKIIQSGVWTEAQIQAICETIADNIDGVTYMPVDFVGRGLPYVEAGDTFEILTKSNDSITTIVLNHTITGEMTLTDSYKSV